MTRSAATVLAADDDPIVRADLRLVLEHAGFDVCEDARDGVEAVELARTHRPDVIVLDLAMPRLDGVEATRCILGERDVPIVALTGHGRAAGGIAERAVAAGVSSVVEKPFADHVVVRAVHDALAAHTARVRTRSLETLTELVGLLGYAEECASALESQSYAAGTIWVRAR